MAYNQNPSFQVNSSLILDVDFTILQSIFLFTPVNDFVINSIITIFDSVVDDAAGLLFDLGTNSPSYNNIAINLGPISLASGTFSQMFLGSIGILPIINSGIPIFLNITSPETATTCTGRIFINGSYI